MGDLDAVKSKYDSGLFVVFVNMGDTKEFQVSHPYP